MIERILKHWDFTDTEILEQLHKDSPRLIYKIIADSKLYILKGIPEEKPESVIVGNVSAHKYLGNEKRIAPRIFAMSNGNFYVKENGFWFYLMEFINGIPMENTEGNEYLLGKLAKQYHSYTDYDKPSEFNEDKQRFYEWFCDRDFKKEFDRILDGLSDFSKLDRCFIHTDLGPHNAMITVEGKAVLIDLDDAGIGCRYFDLGYSFICQFVEHDDKMNMRYRFDYAKSLLNGYYGTKISRSEYDLLWQGAIYMHVSYMKCYGEDAVDSLWKILKFGIAQKEELWELL